MAEQLPLTDLGTRLAEERTDLAAERTREASERTLMAWIRTSLAMIGFGFGTNKLFAFVLVKGSDGSREMSVLWFTTGLVAWGTLLLIGAILQYRANMQRLHKRFAMASVFPLVLVGAAGMAIFGLFALADLLLFGVATH